MQLRRLFSINLFIALFFGLSCAVFPAWVSSLYALPSDAASIWLCRLVGGSILGYATLMWYGWKFAPAGACKAIALALFVQDSIGFIASMEIQLSGQINAFGWTSPLLYGLLALGYAWFFFSQTGES